MLGKNSLSVAHGSFLQLIEYSHKDGDLHCEIGPVGTLIDSQGNRRDVYFLEGRQYSYNSWVKKMRHRKLELLGI